MCHLLMRVPNSSLMVFCMFSVHSQLHWFLISRDKMFRATSASAVSDPVRKKTDKRGRVQLTSVLHVKTKLPPLSDRRFNTAPLWPGCESADLNCS